MPNAQTLTETLIQGGLIRKLEAPKSFYRALFGNTFLAKSDVIIFDDVFEDYRGIAKFVAPNVVSKVNQNKNFDVKSFRPAYAKEKDSIDAWDERLQHRVAGEQLFGSMTPAQRAMAIRAKQMQMHRIKMANLYELMAFNAFSRGELAISGDDYPTTTVSYFRDPALTMSTLGADKWTAAGVSPLTILAKMSDLVYEKSHTSEVDTLIMGRGAWAAFYAYFSAKERSHLLDRNIRGSDLTMNLLHVGDVRGVAMVARFTALNGTTIEVYVDNRSYLGADGLPKRYVADGEVIGFDSREFAGVMAFGAIKDADAGWVATEMHHKEFRVDEPSTTYLLTQSAPLPITLTPNSVFRIADVTK